MANAVCTQLLLLLLAKHMATPLLSLACRGARSDMHACQSDWYNASTAPAARAVLKASYLDRQCSAGYGGRLCSQCQPGYGVSGVIINTFIVFAYILIAYFHVLIGKP